MTARSGALRRRRKPSFIARLRIVWVFVAIGIALVAYAAYALVTLPELRVHSISVRSDGSAVSERQVLQAANIDRSSNLWLLQTTQIATRIEAIPFVDRATIQRVFPAKLSIAVTERVPAACVRTGTQTVTVDGRRRILQAGCGRWVMLHIVVPQARLDVAGSTLNAPVLATLLTDGRTLDAERVHVRSLWQDRFGQLVGVQDNGLVLLLGSDTDLAQKAKLVEPILAATGSGRKIRALDLRAPATPIVQFR